MRSYNTMRLENSCKRAEVITFVSRSSPASGPPFFRFSVKAWQFSLQRGWFYSVFSSDKLVLTGHFSVFLQVICKALSSLRINGPRSCWKVTVSRSFLTPQNKPGKWASLRSRLGLKSPYRRRCQMLTDLACRTCFQTQFGLLGELGQFLFIWFNVLVSRSLADCLLTWEYFCLLAVALKQSHFKSN